MVVWWVPSGRERGMVRSGVEVEAPVLVVDQVVAREPPARRSFSARASVSGSSQV
jgi:hypothetical protein